GTVQSRVPGPEHRARIGSPQRDHVRKRGGDGIFVARIANPALAQFEKTFVEQIAAEMNTTPDEALMRLFSETPSSPNVIFFSMNEIDVQEALKQPWVSLGSDSGSPTPQARATNVGTH